MTQEAKIPQENNSLGEILCKLHLLSTSLLTASQNPHLFLDQISFLLNKHRNQFNAVRQEVIQLKKQVKAKNKEIHRLEKEITSITAANEEDNRIKQAKVNKLVQCNMELENRLARLKELKQANEIQKLLRKNQQLESQLSNCRSELARSDKILQNMVDKSEYTALADSNSNLVKRVRELERIQKQLKVVECEKYHILQQMLEGKEKILEMELQIEKKNMQSEANQKTIQQLLQQGNCDAIFNDTLSCRSSQTCQSVNLDDLNTKSLSPIKKKKKSSSKLNRKYSVEYDSSCVIPEQVEQLTSERQSWLQISHIVSLFVIVMLGAALV